MTRPSTSRPASAAAFRLPATAGYPLERSIAHKLRRASREVMRALERHVAQYGVPPGVWFFLRVLWEVQSIGQAELAERAGVMGPATAAAMDRMERLGLITRVRSADDKRRVDVHLTVKGRKLREQLMPEAIGIVNAALDGFTVDEADRLHAALDRVIHNLETLNRGAPPDASARGTRARRTPRADR